MKTDDKFKNISVRPVDSLVNQMVSTAERNDSHKTKEQLQQQLLECAVLAHEIQKRICGEYK